MLYSGLVISPELTLMVVTKSPNGQGSPQQQLFQETETFLLAIQEVVEAISLAQLHSAIPSERLEQLCQKYGLDPESLREINVRTILGIENPLLDDTD